MVKSKKVGAKKADESKTFAFLVTFLSIVGFIIALLTKKDDKYVMFYAKQSLGVFLVWVVASILMFLPIIGWVVYVVFVALWVVSWIYALSGEEKEVPIVGSFVRKINF